MTRIIESTRGKSPLETSQTIRDGKSRKPTEIQGFGKLIIQFDRVIALGIYGLLKIGLDLIHPQIELCEAKTCWLIFEKRKDYGLEFTPTFGTSL